MESKTYEISLVRVKQAFKDNFARELNDIEAKDIVDQLTTFTREMNRSIPGYKDSDESRYYSGVIDVAFSPNAVLGQIGWILENFGEEKLEKENRFKRARELFHATEFVLVLKKIYGEKWYIKAQDAPDIILANLSGESWRKKPIKGIELEIMKVPHLISSGWQQEESFNQQLVDFVVKDKFLMRYGECPHLLVFCDFNKTGVNFKKISELLRTVKTKNPYHQIWMCANISPDQTLYQANLVYPDFNSTTINKVADHDLYF